MNLHDTYHRLEQDARDYADADRVLRVVRRRRAVRTAAGAAFAALVIAGFGLQSLVRPSGDTIVAVPAMSASPASYPALPAQGPVGQGAAVYTPCRDGCPTLLALADGRQYLLGAHTVTPPGNITLSPDGRWLGRPTENGYELRDLLGDTVRRVAGVSPATGETGYAYGPWAWSADSRRLILAYHLDGNVGKYLDVDLETGVATAPPAPEGYEPVGILNPGDLVLLDVSQYEGVRREVKLRVGAVEVTFRATADGVLADADHGLTVQVRGDRIFLLEYTGEKVAVLQFDRKGALESRTPLADGRYPVGPTPDGYAVVQVPRDQPNGRQRLLAGDRVLQEFPGEAEIVIPGGARH
ncbi:hypothetical protein [Sphaerisporangium fuscum]|uniref:hypothetical protein n=1 Tax=Sphaerisporangium fuscum TaxID=2835868 RepID=UPI001BDC2B58|nr:hypothetical protein [Sphaerisporangium fuscum]